MDSFMRSFLWLNCNREFSECAFTLIELIVVLSILGVLTLIALPSIQNAILKTQITQIHADMKAIALSLESYYLDCSGYPITFGSPFQRLRSIDDMHELTTPVCYLYSIPVMPWMGEKFYFMENGKTISSIRSNYTVGTSVIVGEIKNLVKSDWDISTGGPLTAKSGPQPRYWYSCTNGLMSAGGFWLDSKGLSSF